MPLKNEMEGLDATACADLVRRRQVTPGELVEAAIERIEALQPLLNFIVTPAYDRGRAAARRVDLDAPFAGVPYLVKDNQQVAGLPTRHGSRSTASLPPAASQSPYLDATEEAGLVILGTSALPEFSMSPTTEALAFGPTRNPWNTEHSTGGSSGGAGAAVASGAVLMAHGNDAGGSIRIPASCCGVFGLKPSVGRLRPAGAPFAPPAALSVEHPLTRSVRDSAGMFAATEQRSDAFPEPVGLVQGPSSRRLRIGMVLDNLAGTPPHHDVRAAIESTARLLRDLGHTVVETAWPLDGPSLSHGFFKVKLHAVVAGFLDEVRHALGHTVEAGAIEPWLRDATRLAATRDADALNRVDRMLEAVPVQTAAWFRDFDVVLSPVHRTPPARLGYFDPTLPADAYQERVRDFVGYTFLHNIYGGPGMSVPLYWSESGLPIGSQFLAALGNEPMLFALAYELEAARPWATRRPPIFTA